MRMDLESSMGTTIVIEKATGREIEMLIPCFDLLARLSEQDVRSLPWPSVLSNPESIIRSFLLEGLYCRCDLARRGEALRFQHDCGTCSLIEGF